MVKLVSNKTWFVGRAIVKMKNSIRNHNKITLQGLRKYSSGIIEMYYKTNLNIENDLSFRSYNDSGLEGVLRPFSVKKVNGYLVKYFGVC